MLAAALENGETSSCFPAHYYIVTECFSDRDEIWIRVEYAVEE